MQVDEEVVRALPRNQRVMSERHEYPPTSNIYAAGLCACRIVLPYLPYLPYL